MPKLLSAVLCTLALVTAAATPGLAAVNCGLVKKDLDLGRKPQDIAERMGITVEDVKKCQEQGGTGTTAPAPSGGPKPGTPSPTEKTGK